MTDLREEILARLLVIVTGIPNIRWAQRNNPDWPDAQLPVVMLNDGDEEWTAPPTSLGAPATGPTSYR